jgi:hypothetical protein
VTLVLPPTIADDNAPPLDDRHFIRVLELSGAIEGQRLAALRTVPAIEPRAPAGAGQSLSAVMPEIMPACTSIEPNLTQPEPTSHQKHRDKSA